MDEWAQNRAEEDAAALAGEYTHDPDGELILFSRLPFKFRKELMPRLKTFEGSVDEKVDLKNVRILWIVEGTLQLTIAKERVGIYEAPCVLCDVADVLSNKGNISLDPFKESEATRVRVLSKDDYQCMIEEHPWTENVFLQQIYPVALAEAQIWLALMPVMKVVSNQYFDKLFGKCRVRKCRLGEQFKLRWGEHAPPTLA